MRRKCILILSALAAVLLPMKNALAQGCASCYTTAAAGGTQTIHALRNGIIVLFVPPAVIFAGLLFVVGRWRTGAETRLPVPDRNGSPEIKDLS